MENRCGDCEYCVTDVTRSYCAIKELYTYIDRDDRACEEYLPK